MSFTRSGGLLGTPPPPIELRASDLSPEEAAAWAEVERSGFLDRYAAPTEPTIGGDQYQYDLIVRRGEDEQAVRVTEFDVPPELARLTGLLERRLDDADRRRRNCSPP